METLKIQVKRFKEKQRTDVLDDRYDDPISTIRRDLSYWPRSLVAIPSLIVQNLFGTYMPGLLIWKR